MEFMSALGSQEDAYRPSLFELIAQEKLREMLQPAVQYVLAVYAQRYPRFLIRIVNKHEEFYAGLMLLIERHYLKEWGASFAENFYGLKRVATQAATNGQFIAPGSDQSSQKLSTKDINRSLLFLVGLPYIKSKLDLLYSQVSGGASASLLGENEQEERELEILNDPSASVRTKAVVHLKRIFRKVYPVVNMLYYGSNLCYNIGYLFGKTKYYTPWLRILDIEVKRMSMDDYRAHYEKSMMGVPSVQPTSVIGRSTHFLGTVLGKMIELLKVLLPMSIFFFKFLEWWYASEFARGGGRTGAYGDEEANIIPPPEKVKPDPRGTKVPSTPNTCPLCLTRPINNPTALPSGYVFCYTCAYRYVEDHGRCPVTWTKIRGGTERLTKVYSGSAGGM
ncbi:hypothetical protein K450DRAFT_185083 [Umbelopsis ramanniana AG]|uniref:Peroxisome assembly protein 12 n=1 Tax=Umbelopsis ramanniana AG TaxID=1314678 RepID=A0AAD5HGJ3_UMBRA|nr:uncharacterized protein K450DRAFT_185083 [Umbelopsis ramanniana AG]KAI8582164.1 hypothetical protein K450DRAFT_185083 [Umbelopsis ramanniana AG]